MGLLKPEDWSARWIAAAAGPAPILRKSWKLADKPVAKARLAVTALGLYEVRLNGRRVGDHVLAPEWTDYNKRIRCQVYDVTGLLRAGDNALAALLGNGWYCGQVGVIKQAYGKQPALLAQLEITYADGSTDRIVSDERWKTAASPILSADFMQGESYDARRELPHWDEPGMDDSNWTAAVVRTEKPRLLDGQVMEPIRARRVARGPSASPSPGWT